MAGSVAPPHGRVIHRLPDYAVSGSRVRSVETIPAVSRSSSFRWWERTDPYWNDGLFDAHRPWTTMHNATQIHKRSGSVNVYADASESPSTPDGAGQLWLPEAEEEVEYLKRIAATLFGCGVATTEHLAAIAGVPKTFIYDSLADTGIAEYSWHHVPGRPYPRLQVWRLKLDSGQWSVFSAMCAVDGRAKTMFCGQHPLKPLGPGRSHVRHQVLALELMLRAMEIGDKWVGWLPESACSPSQFCPDTHAGRDDRSLMRADGCLVRIDGVRVFVEIQASNSVKSAADKVLRWSKLLDEGAFSGLVLFVSASRTGLGGTGPQALKKAVEDNASTSAARSLLVGWWADYSPDLGQATEAAGSLRAGVQHDGRWVETEAGSADAERSEGDWHLLSVVSELDTNPEWIGEQAVCHVG